MMLRNRPSIGQPIPNPPLNWPRIAQPNVVEKSEPVVPMTKPEPTLTQELPAHPQTNKRKVRAHNKDGEFVADDPATPENEAWVELPEVSQ
jgi:hypothetical protein